MGVPYEVFLAIYAIAQCLFGVASQADRRSKTLYGRVFSDEPTGRALLIGLFAGQIFWFGLIAIGFISLKWYLALALFFFPGALGGIAYSLLTMRRGFDPGLLHNWAAGLSGCAVAGLTAFLWVQRWMH